MLPKSRLCAANIAPARPIRRATSDTRDVRLQQRPVDTIIVSQEVQNRDEVREVGSDGHVVNLNTS
jgi:hypothetical protein